MDILDFYYKKLKNARKAFRLNHTEENRMSFIEALKNYNVIVAGREELI